MTGIRAVRGPDGVMEVRLTGHAAGSPAVCAALSGLTCALAGYLREDPAAEVLEARLVPGEAVFRFTGDAGTAGAFALTAAGLRQIAAGYPAYARME